MDRGAWQAVVCGVTKESDLTKRLNNNHHNILGSVCGGSAYILFHLFLLL